MAFKATLSIEGSNSGKKEFDILSCHFNFNRTIDTRGMPIGAVGDGLIYVEIESVAGMNLLAHLVNLERIKGTLKFYKIQDDQRMKEVKFQDAYIIQYSEAMVAAGSQPMTTNLTISSRIIEVDGDNVQWKWSLNDTGSGNP